MLKSSSLPVAARARGTKQRQGRAARGAAAGGGGALEKSTPFTHHGLGASLLRRDSKQHEPSRSELVVLDHAPGD